MRLRLLLALAAFALPACGNGDSQTTDTQTNSDVADAPAGDATDGTEILEDTGNLCSTAQLAENFESNIRPHLGNCRSCHDMTVPAGILKAPGPQWFHPTDSTAIIEYLLANGLVDTVHPSFSLFLLKPLSIACGGLKHSGGDAIACDGPAHKAFIEFLSAASPCVPE